MVRGPQRGGPDLTAPAPLLQLDGVSVRRGDRNILDNVNLDIAAGRHTAIIGANGSGKSTLVQLIAHQIHPLGGSGVRVFGQSNWNVFDLRRRLGIVSSALQADFDGDGDMPVLNAVLSGFFASRGVWRNHVVTDEMIAQARDALNRIEIGHLAERQSTTLSTGEARRVLIARALVHRPEALLLDEPCAGLDPATRRRFLDSLRGLARDGVTLLLVTHHIEEILPEISHVVAMQDGRVAGDGPRDRVLTDDFVTRLFGMTASIEKDGDWLSLCLQP